MYATSAGGKLTFHASAAAAAAAEAAAAASENSASAAQPQPPPKKTALGRGVPPPVPPNKPVVPPKKDSVVGRKVEGGVDGATAGAKLGLVSKDKAPQVGRELNVGPSVCGVDSLHANAATAPARPASSHAPSSSSGELSGNITSIRIQFTNPSFNFHVNFLTSLNFSLWEISWKTLHKTLLFQKN